MRFPYSGLGNQSRKKRQPPQANGRQGKVPKKRNCRHILGALAALLWLGGLILGIVALVGCISPNMDGLYVAELGTSDQFNVTFHVGFFGGCLSMTNKTGGPQISSTETSHTQCVMNMRVKDDDDLSQQLRDDWPDSAATELQNSVNKTLPLARRLQGNVFPASPPTTHVLFFLISGIMLFVCSTNMSPKRGYKIALVLAVLLGAFALALTFLSSIGSLRALNALVDGDSSRQTINVPGGIVVNRAGPLWYLQLAQVVVVSSFYIFIGCMFV